MKNIIFWWRNRANKPVTIVILILHLLLLGSFTPYCFSWSGVIISIILYCITIGLGIGVCYHRLLTHRSFKTPKWVRCILTLCGCLAWQGSPIIWVGTHRYHHKHSDKDDDPHSPKHGFTWAHIIWVLTKSPEGFKETDQAKDLLKEPMMMKMHKWFWLPQVIVAILLILGGLYFGGIQLALSWFMWGIVIRTIAAFHFTWFVNSAAHTWGYTNFNNTDDNSKNLWWVAIFSFGEGWHNNHHGEPSSASHGMRGFELDPTYWIISLMGLLGLASDIKKPKRWKKK